MSILALIHSYQTKQNLYRRRCRVIRSFRHVVSAEMASYTINDDLFEDDPEEASPSELNTKNCGQFIEVSKDKLSVKYIGTGTHTNDVGAIQANRPAPTQRLLYYFEVAVRDRGEKGRISVGFTEKSFKMSRQPG